MVNVTTQKITNDREVGIEVVTLTIAIGQTTIEQNVEIAGKLNKIIVVTPAVADLETFTVTLEDGDDVDYWTQAAIAANQTNSYYPVVGTYFQPLVVSPVTVVATMSATELVARTVTVEIIYSRK